MDELEQLITREDGAAIQPLPEGGVLLHIGPPKTGTSALQGACHACRDEMRAQGCAMQVGLSSREVPHLRCSAASIQRWEAPSAHHWKRLVNEVRAAKESRVFVSSEFFLGQMMHKLLVSSVSSVGTECMSP